MSIPERERERGGETDTRRYTQRGREREKGRVRKWGRATERGRRKERGRETKREREGERQRKEEGERCRSPITSAFHLHANTKHHTAFAFYKLIIVYPFQGLSVIFTRNTIWSGGGGRYVSVPHVANYSPSFVNHESRFVLFKYLFMMHHKETISVTRPYLWYDGLYWNRPFTFSVVSL